MMRRVLQYAGQRAGRCAGRFAGGLALALLLATPAQADDRYDGADWGWSLLAGGGGAVVGGAAFAGLTVALLDDDVGGAGLGAVLLGIPVGAAIGGTAGAWLYGDLSGHETRWWAPVLGGLVGSGLGFAGFIGATRIDSDVGQVIGFSSILLLPAVGATTGYALGLKRRETAARAGPHAPPASVQLMPTRLDGGWAGTLAVRF